MTGLEKVKKVSDEMKFMVSNGTMATNRTDQANDYSVFSNDIDNAAEEIRREFEDKDAEIANLKSQVRSLEKAYREVTTKPDLGESDLEGLVEFLSREAELPSESFKARVVEKFGMDRWNRHLERKHMYAMASRIIGEIAKYKAALMPVLAFRYTEEDLAEFVAFKAAKAFNELREVVDESEAM